MAKYRITTPDGHVYDIEGPDGASDEDVIAAAQAHLKQVEPGKDFAKPVKGEDVVEGDLAGLVSGKSEAERYAGKLDKVQGKYGAGDLATTGATLGLSDEAAGVGNALYNTVSSPFTDAEFDPIKSYQVGRDAERIRLDEARANSGALGTAAEIAGGFGSGGNAGGVATTLGQRMLQGAKAGATGGAVAGYGYGEGLTGSALSAGLGGAGGAVIGTSIPLIGELIANRVNGLRRLLGRDPDLPRRLVSEAIQADSNTPQTVGQLMDAAHGRGSPTMLADTGENTRALLASVARQPGPARSQTRAAVTERQEGQGDRIIQAIRDNLGTVENHYEVADQLTEQAKKAAGPIYERLYSSEPISSEALDNLLSRPSMKKAIERAGRIAAEEGRDPKALGLAIGDDGRPLLEPGQTFSQAEAAQANPSRFQDVSAPDPKAELGVRVLTGKGGRKVRIRGPLDITQRLRTLGGIQDQGGELSHMGLTNKPRRMEFGSNEQFLGNLIDNERGMNLDDATFKLWEEGYFPEFVERPTPRELLDRLKLESMGQRQFHPESMDEVSRFSEARDMENTVNKMADEGAPLADDPSEPVTFDTMPSAPAGGARDIAQVRTYSPQTLDYIKRGLDDVVETYRDSTTGKLNLDTEGRAINNTLRQFLGVVDNLYPDYGAARKAFAGPISGRNALQKGLRALSKNADDITAQTKDMSPYELDMYRLGVRRAMADLVAGKGDYANKVQALLGSPKKRQALQQLFAGQDVVRFGQTLGDEAAANETFNSVARGSQTAERQAFDQETSDSGLAEAAIDAAIRGGKNGMTGIIAEAISALRDVSKFGPGRAGQQVRERAAALLTETDPTVLRELIRAAQRASARQRVNASTRTRKAVGQGYTAGRGIGTAVGATQPQ